MSDIAVTVDAVVVSTKEDDLEGWPHVLLITRKYEPFTGEYALPGGFVEADEDLAAAASRELLEETGLALNPLIQLTERSAPNRDPRQRVISFPFLFLAKNCPLVEGGDDASSAQWVLAETVADIGMAFDHEDILAEASEYLASTAELVLQPRVRQAITIMNVLQQQPQD